MSTLLGRVSDANAKFYTILKELRFEYKQKEAMHSLFRHTELLLGAKSWDKYQGVYSVELLLNPDFKSLCTDREDKAIFFNIDNAR